MSSDAVEPGELALSPGDLPRVAAELAHSVRAVRRRAAGALSAALAAGSIQPSDCEPLLDSNDGDVRWGTAFALVRAGVASARAVETAVEALDSADGDVRWAAASIVIASARASAALRDRLRALARAGTLNQRKMAILCLSESGESVPHVYVEALRDKEPLVRLAAVTAIARGPAASAEARAALEAVLASDDEPAVRRAAAAVARRLEEGERTGKPDE